MRIQARGLWFGTAVLAAAGWGAAAHATILEDFQFSDIAGTAYNAVFNDAGTGHGWDTDDPGDDLLGVATNGAGQLDLSAKANDEFGTTYVDADDINGGQIYGVMELTWDFDTATLNTAENEEIRLSLIQFDPRSTFVTAEFEIERTDTGEVIIFGNAVGTGATDTPDYTLTPTQSTKFIAIIAANLNTDTMGLYFSADGGASWTSDLSGDLDPTRGFGSLRATYNNDLSDDNILIDRIYLTNMNPYPGLIVDVPEPAGLLLLGVGTALLTVRRR